MFSALNIRTSYKTAEKLIQELEVLPTCGVCIPLVIIEPDILKSLSDDLIARLIAFALDTPFLLAGEEELQADLAEIFEAKTRTYRRPLKMLPMV